ncbi:hypothetical protein [Brachyspira pilosicoli]|uniref:hypothetical protein n=1 Tax=Brachyspira pilosicoli TaxID=52584 RepID=UPI0026658E04|nr:hypothetical protein [Brachyspira pilosicoli]
MKAKTGSNAVKALIVVFLFCEYHLQSMSQGSPLSADSCQGLLFIAIAGFLILLPVDGSIFIKNFFNAKNHIKDIESKKDIENIKAALSLSEKQSKEKE